MPKRERAKIEDSKIPAKRKTAATAAKRGDGSDIVPRDSDVLCGRGDNINRHPGNIKFRELVERKKRVYLSSHFKREKRMIADNIVATIRNGSPPGRFLAKNPKNGLWESVDDNRAREKTSQALREKARVAKADLDNEIRRQYASEQQQLETVDSGDQEQPVLNAVTGTEESKEAGQPPKYARGNTTFGIQQPSQVGSVHASHYPQPYPPYPYPQPSVGPYGYPQFPSSYPGPQGYSQGMPLNNSNSTGMTHTSLSSAQSMQQTYSFQQQQLSTMNRTRGSSCIQSPSAADGDTLMPNTFSSQVDTSTTEESKLNNTTPASPTLSARGSPLEISSSTPLSTGTFEALQRVVFPETSPEAPSQDDILVPSLDSPLQPTPLPTVRSQASAVHQSWPTQSAQLHIPDPTNTSLLQQSMAASLSRRNNTPQEFVQQQQLNSVSHQGQTIPQMNVPQSQWSTLGGTMPQANRDLPHDFQQQLEEVQERQRQIQLQLMAQQHQQQNQHQQQWHPHLQPRNLHQQPQESKQEQQIPQNQHSTIYTAFSPIVTIRQNNQQLAIPATNLGSDSVPYSSSATQKLLRRTALICKGFKVNNSTVT